MESLMKILKELDGSIAWETENALIDDRILDSFGVISLVSELEDTFDIEIEPMELTAQNFNSANAIWNLVQRLQVK